VPNLFSPLPGETRRLLDGIPALIDRTFPLPGRFRSGLSADVAELSRLLTSGRGERGLSYLGRPAMLSAYLRFFLPWNLFRLCRLLPGLDLDLKSGDVVTDLGSGPLTLASALWICRPDLREASIEFQCIDRSGTALEAGKKFFAALSGEGCRWKIRTSRGELGAERASPANLVCAANVLNEMYGDVSRAARGDMGRNAEKSARLLLAHAAPGASVLVVEPGFPRCGEFVALVRGALTERGLAPLAPCPHAAACPMPGGQRGERKRWCHFAFETADAPAELLRLSAAAGLPKERATMSFLLAGRHAEATREAASADVSQRKEAVPVRVVSDAFPLPNQRLGRYCCSGKGLALLAGERHEIENARSGALADAVFARGGTDRKSGLPICHLIRSCR